MKDEEDPHKKLASELWNKPIEEVTDEERRRAKIIGHTRNYCIDTEFAKNFHINKLTKG